MKSISRDSGSQHSYAVVVNQNQELNHKENLESEETSADFGHFLYRILVVQTNKGECRFEPYGEYTLAEILGKEFYGEDHTIHRAVGLLFGRLAKEGLIPFSRTDTVPFGPALYTYFP